ncbi:MAG: zf-TFIIB domain-containing protein [Akkermansiaceae bacterium]|jgi:Zn-finger nucleic acid-binding protein|nr:zf-TFIIB domain-containing protein [Akkermansiaceae bacterium]
MPAMLCYQCGGRLEGDHTVCPFCGVHQRIDLRQIHFRDLGACDQLPCPICKTPLHSLKTETEPATHIEHCPTCFGLFFNPGELETTLHENTTDGIWLDNTRLTSIEARTPAQPAEITYRKCPHCEDIMTRINFGGRSGVIIDRCMRHGVWLDHGELHHLLQWWHAGGKWIYKNHLTRTARPPTPTYTPLYEPGPATYYPEDDRAWDAWDILKILGGLALFILKMAK